MVFMKDILLTGSKAKNNPSSNLIYCPSLEGLTSTQADLAYVMPRVNHNQAVREAGKQGDWAAVLACDPFGSHSTLFKEILDLGYKGIANWPSSILVDGSMRQWISTIPVSPELEYDFLIQAERTGLDSLAFFCSLDQARLALDKGLRKLVLHPGIIDVENQVSGQALHRSLINMIKSIRYEEPEIAIYAYTSQSHQQVLNVDELGADGTIYYEE